jgi:hypothetical protein
VTRTVTDSTERARLGGDLSAYARVLILDADNVWRDLTAFHGVDWFVSAEIGSTIDDRAATLSLVLVRETIDADVGAMSLAPQIVASPANHKADTTYAPLINPARKIRVLVDIEAYGDAPLTHSTWKRIFDGKIDSVDPATSPDNTITVRARDRAAWLLNTWIESKRPYGSDAGAGTPVETVVQQIIDDNAVPFGATLVVPTSPDFNLGAFDQDDQSSVMDAIYALALLQGGDIRYLFRDDGDTDPELLYIVPDRAKTVPDWQFGPDEYIEITTAPIDDSDVRNAITVDYPDSAAGSRQQITRTNAASINAFGRRWGKITIKDHSQIDTATEATTLGDSAVSDLGSPPFEHEMRTFLFWPLTLGDLVRFLSNSTLYDQDQDLAIVSYTHTIETGGVAYTTMRCKGAPAGAYRGWLGLLSGTGGAPITVHPTYDIVAIDATSITLAISGTIEGSSTLPLVAWAWTTLNPIVSRISGALQMVFVANGSQWTFARPNPGAGDGTVGFLVGNDVLSSALLQVPIPEGTSFPSPTIDDPSVSVIDDPTNDFDVDWSGVHSMPSGVQYKMYWRFTSGGGWSTHGFTTSVSDTIAHSEHGQVITGLGTQNAEMQVYVEAFDSFGAHIAQSAVVTKTYHFEGFG